MEYVLNNCTACTLNGYRRAYEGYSETWDGKSVATVIQDENAQIDAFAFHMTPDQVLMMNKFEGYPNIYYREEVQLVDKLGIYFSAQVYIINSTGIFNYPTHEYLDANSLTLMAYHYLPPINREVDFDYNKITYPIYNGVTGEKVDDYMWGGIHYDFITSQYMENSLKLDAQI